jgi:hypothetical protein
MTLLFLLSKGDPSAQCPWTMIISEMSAEIIALGVV